MNQITITQPLDADRQPKPEDLQKIELELSPEADKILMPALKQEHLLSILRGETTQLADGMTRYVFYIPFENAELLKQAFLQAYTKVNGYLTTN